MGMQLTWGRALGPERKSSNEDKPKLWLFLVRPQTGPAFYHPASYWDSYLWIRVDTQEAGLSDTNALVAVSRNHSNFSAASGPPRIKVRSLSQELIL